MSVGCDDVSAEHVHSDNSMFFDCSGSLFELDENVSENNGINSNEEDNYISTMWKSYIDGENNDGFTGLDNFKPPFVHQHKLSPYQIAQVSLLKILSEHKGTDLKLFDRIMKWVLFFSDKYPTIWKSSELYKNPTRKNAMKFFTNHFGLEKCFPDSKVVQLSDGRKVSVPVYDFAAQLRSLVQNEDLFNDQI